MSWFGDHISSISGKLQDIGKAVNENINSSFLDVSGQASPAKAHSGRADETLDDDGLFNEESASNMSIHQDNSLLIDQLIAEKKELEEKIILLDEQHQETMDELLQRKSEMVAENKRLKSQLKEKEAEIKQSQNTSSFSDTMKRLDNLDVSNPRSVLENINVLFLLMPFKNCIEKSAIENQINKLRKICDELRTGSHVTDPDGIESLTKINTYIEYLNLICDHEQQLLPFMKEVAETIFMEPVKNNAEMQCDMNVMKSMPDLKTQPSQTYSSQFLDNTLSNSCQTEKASCPHCDEISLKLMEVYAINDRLQIELDALNSKEKELHDIFSVSCQTDFVIDEEHDDNEKELEQQLLNEKLEEEINHLRVELESSKKEYNVLQEQYSCISQKKEKDKNSLEAARNEITLFKREISEMERFCKDLKNKQTEFIDWIDSGCEVLRKDEHSKLLDDINNLQSSIKSKEELINENNLTICDLSQQLKVIKKASKQNDKQSIEIIETLNEKLHKKELEYDEIWDENRLLCNKLKVIEQASKQNDMQSIEIIETLNEKLDKKQLEYDEILNENRLLSSKLSELDQKTEDDSEKISSSFSCQTDPIDCVECIQSKDFIKELSLLSESLKQEIVVLRDNQNISSQAKTSVSQQTDTTCECEALRAEMAKTADETEKFMQQMKHEKENLLDQIEKQTNISQNLSKSLHDREAVVSTLEKNMFIKMQDIASLNRTVNALELKISDMKKHMMVNGAEIQSKRSVDLRENSILQADREQEQLSMSVCDNDKLILQEKLKALDLEKNRLLSVLSDKSRECSSLKSEVHRLTSVVASEKQALMKLQQDNKDLKDGRENGLDPDLTREALKNLSQLVRSKDLEIGALQQKNDSLSEIVKQSCSGADQVQALIEEREDLLKQISQYKANRDKIMSTYNNKDQECRNQLAEIKTLKTELDSRNQELDSLQQQYSSISLQYEEKQKALIATQNETIVMKQQVSEMKQCYEEIQRKHDELLNQFNTDTCVVLATDEHSKLLSDIEDLRSSVSSKEKLINEKDSMIHDLSQNLKAIKLTSSELEKTIAELKKANKNLGETLEEKQLDVEKVLKEKELVNDKLSDKQSELSLLRDMNERLNMALKEKEFSVESLEEKINDLSKVILGSSASPNNESGSLDVDQILASSKDMYIKAQGFHRERDETLLALTQCQQENQELRNEIQRLRTVEIHMKSELDRLRKHLLQVEENYTNEALRAEEREKELRNHLAELEHSVRLSSSESLETSQQASVQISSLQEQISIIAQQRDQALGQLSDFEDKVQQYAASLSNLQLVLEQKQKGHNQKMKEMEKKYNLKLNESQMRCIELQNLVEKKQAQLEESSEALEAASRLSEQLDAKEEIISRLKGDLARAETKMQSTVQEIDCIKSNSEGKVDRVVMKSLVLGYFSTPPGQKSEVIRLLARVLDFNQEEMAKAGIVVSRNTGTIEHRGIFSSILGRLPSLTSVPRPLQATQQENHPESSQSFTTLFVRFLENESQPVVHMPLPAEKMAQEMTSKAHSNRTSSKAFSSSSVTPNSSPLFVGIDAAFPNFGPFPAFENSTPAPTILKRVLD